MTLAEYPVVAYTRSHAVFGNASCDVAILFDGPIGVVYCVIQVMGLRLGEGIDQIVYGHRHRLA